MPVSILRHHCNLVVAIGAFAALAACKSPSKENAAKPATEASGSAAVPENTGLLRADSGSAAAASLPVASAGSGEPVAAADTNAPKADAGTALWSVSIGGIDSDYPRDIAVAADGTSFVVGVFRGTAKFGTLGELTSAGEEDGFIAAIGTDGAVRWVQQLGAQRSDAASGVSTSGKLVLVAGNFTDTMTIGSFSATSKGSDELYVAAFDTATGAPAWIWTAGGFDSDGATDVTATPDGGWLVSGVFTGTAKFGNTVVKSTGSDGSATDAMLVKLAATGEVQWVKSFGGSYADTINHVVVDPAGNIYAFGSFHDKANFGGAELIAGGGSDNNLVLASYTSTGEHRWSKGFGGEFNELAGGLTVDAAGNVTIAGCFEWGIDFGGGERKSAGKEDAFIASFTSDGTLRWDHSYGGTRDDIAYEVAADSDGNVVVVGRFVGTVDFGGGPLTAPHPNRDAFVLKLDPSGKHVWSRSFGDRDHDEGRVVAIDSQDAPIVGGIFRFELALTATPLHGMRDPADTTPNADTFVVKFSP